jgi:predicted TIM-barrel fold metal-dependent hydrolase
MKLDYPLYCFCGLRGNLFLETAPVVIDGHVHIWPDHVAHKALAAPSGDLVRYGDGTVSSVLASMDAAGIDRAISLAVAPTADKVDSANRFAGSLDRQRFIGFGSIHPDLSVEQNLSYLRTYGLRGAKVHPLYQGYSLDDPRLWDVLDAMQGEFAVIVHVGEGDTSESNARCTPQMLRSLALRFPRLDLVACHFGGYRRLDEVEEIVVGLPIHVDTSWPPGLWSLDRRRVRRIIEAHGPDRVVFGSDWPMSDPAANIAAIQELGLSSDDTQAILGGNLGRLLRLE